MAADGPKVIFGVICDMFQHVESMFDDTNATLFEC